MAQKTMYPAQISSPGTELAAAATAGATEITILDASKLPDAPNLATIGSDETAEVVLYTGKDANKLTGVTRGFQGAAKSWSIGARVARYFTAYDHDTFLANLLDLASSKQDVLRLSDNFAVVSKLVNDTADPVYPSGVSMFKVSSAAGGWPAANGYVLTFRAGSGGYQIFYEMYTGAVQTDKTARQWTRSKRDSNTFWQDWAQSLTEVDLAAHNADYVRQPGYTPAVRNSSDVYAGTLSPAPLTPNSLPDGFAVTIVPDAANTTTTPKLQLNNGSIIQIRRNPTTDFAVGAIKAGAPLALIKVGSYFLARSVGATGTATAAQVRAGATFSNESNVDLVGTQPVRATAAQTVTTNQTLASGIYDGAITVAVPDPSIGTTATAADILTGKTSRSNGNLITGTMAPGYKYFEQTNVTGGTYVYPGFAPIQAWATGNYYGSGENVQRQHVGFISNAGGFQARYVSDGNVTSGTSMLTILANTTSNYVQGLPSYNTNVSAAPILIMGAWG